jgi:hypothetical protein
MGRVLIAVAMVRWLREVGLLVVGARAGPWAVVPAGDPGRLGWQDEMLAR